MNVVVDTNIFVSSFFGGHPRKIIDRWKEGRITLCLTREIINEYTSVLVRLGLTDEKELSELLHLFAAGKGIRFAAKTPSLKIVRRDPSDDKFIECAVALKAGHIITGDKALLSVKNYSGIEIVTAREFLSAHFPD
jgi:putative PIN family toxin of toxin-antitoxin system